jgi:hypothetical protein
VYETIDSGAIAVHQAQGDVLGVHSQADCDALAQEGTPVGIPTVTPLAVTATETPAGQTATAVPTANNISVPAATMTAGKVGICHRTGSNKNPYVYLVVSASAVPAHRKHGDIIGVASARDCPAHAVPGNPGNDKGDEDNGDQGNDHGGDNGNGHGNGHGHEHGD